MNQKYLEEWSAVARQIQQPFRAMFELNLKTLKNLSFLKAEELATIKAPEELLEKQIYCLITNGHRALDYFKQSFVIFEQVLLPLRDTVKHSTTALFEQEMNPEAISLMLPLLESVASEFESREAVREIANTTFAIKTNPGPGLKMSDAKKAKKVHGQSLVIRDRH